MTRVRFQVDLIEYLPNPVPDAKWIQLNRWPFDHLSVQLSLSCNKVQESVWYFISLVFSDISEKYQSFQRNAIERKLIISAAQKSKDWKKIKSRAYRWPTCDGEEICLR